MKKTDENNQIKLHPNELWIIRQWRKKYRYGEMTIIINNGIPIRIRRAFINETPDDEKLN